MAKRELSVAASILGLAALLAIIAPSYFEAHNLRDIFLSNAAVLIVAMGMTLVILTGEIDISVGSTFAISGVVAGVLAKAGLPLIVVCAGAVLAGGVLGAINGALVAYARIPSIVVTLATMVALRDGLRWVTQGQWVQDLPERFQWFGLSQSMHSAVFVGVVVILIGLSIWTLRWLSIGRAIYATGSNREAARLAGLDTTLIVFAVFALTGALTGAAALLNATRFNQIPVNAGLGLELKVIAAVVVGGTAITGGRATVVGTLLGVVLLGAIGPALTFMGVSANWERAIQGSIILVAVGGDRIREHIAGHAARRAAASA
ncbi:MAG: ABC transporter permease [Vicinamibacterales bacterium]